MNALIVDDDPVVRMLASKMLEVKGFSVSSVMDKESLIDFLSNNSICPDVILLDLQIGDLTGLEAAEIIHKYYPNIKRLICMSSHTATEVDEIFPNLRKISHLGRKFDLARDFLQKPFQSHLLYEILDS